MMLPDVQREDLAAASGTRKRGHMCGESGVHTLLAGAKVENASSRRISERTSLVSG
jgi:hypothetical protein